MLIVGEAGAGKTSLSKKLVDPQYQLKKGEVSTEGIDICQWQFPLGLRLDEKGEQHVVKRNFRANIWDFGGQEIYHATHQFFLSRRSLYVLVIDNRREDADFNYWLDVIELLGGNSPILIVQNEIQDRKWDIDLSTLRARSSGLKDAYPINLANNKGLRKLGKAIRNELGSLDHVGVALPKTWTRVRDTLKKEERSFISEAEYIELCEQHGFKKRGDKLQLSGYLHDLGICLHFQDDALLKKTLFLKPNWATEAVYRVLDDKKVIDAQGRFDRKDLARIWSEEAYEPVRHELAELMKKFRVCYELPGGDAFIAPQRLSVEKPVYSWPEKDNLVLRYIYDFMPKGLVISVIVALHHLIENQDWVWRSGVVLARDGTRAEIIEDYRHRQITLRLQGADTRGLLAIISDSFDKIHATFKKLSYERHLPCSCEKCRAAERPFSFGLKELEDFARTGDKIQCRTSRQMVDAADLIRDVLPSVYVQLGIHVGHQAEPESKEVYVSYNWWEESDELVNEIEKAFEGKDIDFIRDKKTMDYKDSIQAFMERIGNSKAVIVVLSDAYLKSENCMFELTKIAEAGDFRARIFPVVMPDAAIFKTLIRARYVRYWEDEKTELEKELDGMGRENLKSLNEAIDNYAKYRALMDGLLDHIKDMNVRTVEQHRANNFADIIKALD